MNTSPTIESTTGIRALPWLEYHAIDAVSFSALCDLDESPFHAKWRREHPDESDGDARLRGSALHCLLNEPDEFAKRYVLKDFDGRTKDGKARKAEVEAAGLKALSVEVWDAAHKSADAIRLHPVAKPLLDAAPHAEQSVLWRMDGMLCKGRPDRWGKGLVIDFKSTKDALPRRFPYFASESRVDRQLAWYSYGIAANCGFSVKALDDLWPETWVIAVTDCEPHVVACYEVDEVDLFRAWDEVDALRRRWKACAESASWPSGTEEALRFTRKKWDDADRGDVDSIIL